VGNEADHAQKTIILGHSLRSGVWERMLGIARLQEAMGSFSSIVCSVKESVRGGSSDAIFRNISQFHDVDEGIEKENGVLGWRLGRARDSHANGSSRGGARATASSSKKKVEFPQKW